jgi:hypothetical protein
MFQSKEYDVYFRRLYRKISDKNKIKFKFSGKKSDIDQAEHSRVGSVFGKVLTELEFTVKSNRSEI